MVPIQNRPVRNRRLITDLFKTDHLRHHDLFLLQHCKATTTVNPCIGLQPQLVIAIIRTT